MNIRPSRCGHIAIGKMLAALLDGPQSVEELVEASGLCSTTVRHYVLTFRKLKAVRIAEWQPDRRNRLTVPAYAIGKGRDAVRKVARIDNAARMRSYYARTKANRVLHALAA